MAQQIKQVTVKLENPTLAYIVHSPNAKSKIFSTFDRHLGIVSKDDYEKEQRYKEFAERMHVTVEMLKGEDILPHNLKALDFARLIKKEIVKSATVVELRVFNKKVGDYFDNVKLIKVTDGRDRFKRAQKLGSFTDIMNGIASERKLAMAHTAMLYAKIENRIDMGTGEFSTYSNTCAAFHLDGKWQPTPKFLIPYAQFLGLERDEVKDLFKLADIPYAALEEHLDNIEYGKHEPAPLYDEEYLEKRQKLEEYWKQKYVEKYEASKKVVADNLTAKITEAEKSPHLVKAVLEYSGKKKSKFMKLDNNGNYVPEHRVTRFLRMIGGHGVPTYG